MSIFTLENGTRLEIPDTIPLEQQKSLVQQFITTHPQGKPQSDYGWGDVAIDAVKNIPSSTVGVVKDTFNAITSPIDTLKALGGLALGTAEKLIPGRQDSEVYADAVWQYLNDRYGSEENWKRAIGSDPVGVLADFATVFLGGGGSLAKAGSLASKVAGAGKIANGLTKTGEVLGKVGKRLDPLSIIGESTMKLANLGYGRDMPIAEKVYQSIVKPPTTKYTPQEIKAMMEAGIQNRIPVTRGGVSKANALIEDLNSELDTLIDNADIGGRAYDPTAVALATLDSPARKKLSRQADPVSDLNNFDETVERFYKTHGNETMIRDAQSTKKETYQQNQKKYQNNTTVAHGSQAAEMEIARQLRKVIEDAVPEAKNINKKEKALIGLRDELGRASTRTGSLNILGLIPTIAGAGVASMGNLGEGVATAALLNLLRTPAMKSRMAFALDDFTKTGNTALIRALGATGYSGEQIKRNKKQIER